MKRILIHSAPPWAPSGYGLQCRYLAEALRYLRYDVAISAFGGCHANTTWHGIPILSCGTRPYGNGVIAGNYKHWEADLLITLGDLWVLDPEQFTGLSFAPWLPVDCTPLSVMDKQRLDHLKGPRLHPIAMSRFGAAQLAQAGHPAPVLPHATRFEPDPELGLRWRQEQRIPPGLFLIVKVGVNNEDDRKAFVPTLEAFAQFAADRTDAGLYLHTEPQVPRAPNLAFISEQLGLVSPAKGTKVVFPDPWMRATDRHTDAYMRGMFCAADVVDCTSRAEGFGVPAIEALACGTPVIGSDNSAMPEKLDPDSSWIVGGRREWAKHHHAWWQAPDDGDLTWKYDLAAVAARAGGGYRQAAAKAGEQWSFRNMQATLSDILIEIFTG